MRSRAAGEQGAWAYAAWTRAGLFVYVRAGLTSGLTSGHLTSGLTSGHLTSGLTIGQRGCKGLAQAPACGVAALRASPGVAVTP